MGRWMLKRWTVTESASEVLWYLFRFVCMNGVLMCVKKLTFTW